MVVAGMPVRSATDSGEKSEERYRSAMSWNDVVTLRPSGSVYSPINFGEASGDSAGIALAERPSQTSALPLALRTKRPCCGEPGSRNTSHVALV